MCISNTDTERSIVYHGQITLPNSIHNCATYEDLEIQSGCDEPMKAVFKSSFQPLESKCITFHADTVPAVVDVFFMVESMGSTLDTPITFTLELPDDVLESKKITLGDTNNPWDEFLDMYNAHIRKWVSNIEYSTSGEYKVR